MSPFVMNAVPAWALRCIRRFGWLPISFMILHLYLARVLVVYRDHPELDDPMHYFGGVTIAWFFWRCVSGEQAAAALGALSDAARVLLVLASVGSATVLWEFGEWSTDHLGISAAQLGLDDTLFDMFLGLAGGSCYVLLAASLERRARARAARQH